MISRKELCIGNWVRNRRNEPMKIVGLTESVIDIVKADGAHKIVSEDDIFPIPIQHIILTRNGFVIDTPEDEWGIYRWSNSVGEDYVVKNRIEIHKYYVVEERREFEPVMWNVSIISDVECPNAEKNFTVCSMPNISYIHHLQNQLSMMCVDKEINITKEMI